MIDFSPRASDAGMYVHGSRTEFFPGGDGPDSVTAGTDFHFVFTRNAATHTITTYLNGVLQAVYDDSTPFAVPLNNVLSFFEDDQATNFGEAAPGSVNYIAIYDGPLNQQDVTALYQISSQTPPTSVTVNEGQTATMNGTFHDSGTSAVTVTSSIGTITQSAGAHGTWSWSYPTNNGPTQSQTVTITATDANGAFSTTTFDLTINNQVPTITVNSGTITVDEGQPATNSGTYADVGADVTSITASVGTVTFANNAWSWSFAATDGPSQSQTVTVTATDSHGATAQTFFSLAVNNVAPTATLSNNGPVGEGSTATVSFSNQFDPSTADTAAGFTYSYDFDNNGSFETPGGASATVPASLLADGPGTRTIGGRIADKDGGFTDYTTTITINNVAPTATFSNSGPVNEG